MANDTQGQQIHFSLLPSHLLSSCLLIFSLISNLMEVTKLNHREVLTAAGLRALQPGSQEYMVRERSYFSVSAQLGPHAIVQPLSAEQVSLAVGLLKTATTCKWAVRGGGHTTWPGASNSMYLPSQ